MNTFTIPEGTKEVKIDQIDNKVIIEFIPQVDKFEPKDGDIVYWHWQNDRDEWSKNVAIFKNSKSTYYCTSLSKHEYVIIEGEFGQDEFDFMYSTATIEFRPATDSEKQLLFDKLAEQGYKWNAEEKKIEKVRWRASEGEKYWSFIGGIVYSDTDDYFPEDNARYNNGLYFKTQEQAMRAHESVKNLLLNTEW